MHSFSKSICRVLTRDREGGCTYALFSHDSGSTFPELYFSLHLRCPGRRGVSCGVKSHMALLAGLNPALPRLHALWTRGQKILISCQCKTTVTPRKLMESHKGESRIWPYVAVLNGPGKLPSLPRQKHPHPEINSLSTGSAGSFSALLHVAFQPNLAGGQTLLRHEGISSNQAHPYLEILILLTPCNSKVTLDPLQRGYAGFTLLG